MRQRDDIHLKHRGNAFPWGRVKQAEISQTGVVNQQIHGNLLSHNPGREAFPLGSKGKIASERIDLELRCFSSQFRSKFCQAFLTAPHQNKTGCLRGKLPGKLQPKSSRGTGDERRTMSRGKWGFHGLMSFLKISRIGCSSSTFSSIPPIAFPS